MTDKPKFQQKDMREEMRRADGGKDTVYPVYKFGNGITEYNKDRIGTEGPRFAGRK